MQEKKNLIVLEVMCFSILLKKRITMKEKRISLVLLVIILISMFSQVVFGYQLISHKLSGGIRNRYYAFDSTVTGYWSTPFYNAVNRWYNTNTYHAFAQTTNINNAQMIFYTYSSSTDGKNGYTAFFSSSNVQINPYATDWSYCQVYLNKYYLASTTTDFDSGVACHELGHVCGLDDNNTMPATIMCQAGSGRTVTSPQSDDCNGINYIYPNGY